jgi:putative tricarboxylic transport membrane protein
MFEGLRMLGESYLGFLNFWSLAYGLGGALLGIVVGVLPGLSATLCIALLTTLTIKLSPNDAILILICAYVGTIYGGSRTAILLNIPGTAANAASCADGYALARKGEAGRAIGIATSGAFTGTLFGVLCLAMFTPALAEIALSFGAFEFFWLALFGVAMSGSIVGEDPLKGWLMGCLGLLVAQIGQEGLYAYDRADPRADRRLRLRRGVDLAGRTDRTQARRRARFRAASLPGGRQILAYRAALRRHRRGDRHPAGRRGGLRRLDVVRRRQGSEP